SVTGASMPPATHDAPEAGAGSSTVTRRPASAARHAQDRPITPAPTTVNEFDIISAPCAGMTRIRFDGRDLVRSPLSPPYGLPCVTCNSPYALPGADTPAAAACALVTTPRKHAAVAPPPIRQ